MYFNGFFLSKPELNKLSLRKSHLFFIGHLIHTTTYSRETKYFLDKIELHTNQIDNLITLGASIAPITKWRKYFGWYQGFENIELIP